MFRGGGVPRESAGGRLPKGLSAQGCLLGVSIQGERVSARGLGGLPRRGVYLEGVCQGMSAQGDVCQTPSEQNHRKVQKHYLAATTLRTVKIY